MFVTAYIRVCPLCFDLEKYKAATFPNDSIHLDFNKTNYEYFDLEIPGTLQRDCARCKEPFLF